MRIRVTALDHLLVAHQQDKSFPLIFCRKNSVLAATAWHPVDFWKNLELWNDMTGIRLVSHKCFKHVSRKSFNFFVEHSSAEFLVLRGYHISGPLSKSFV